MDIFPLTSLTALWPIFLAGLVLLVLRVVVDARGGSRGTGKIDVRAVDDFFNTSEGALHKLLLGIAQDTPVAVFPKVRVLDLVKPNGGSNYRTTVNKLRGMHVDWVLVSLPGFKPLVAVELDGPSHGAARQQNADANKNVALGMAGLPVVRISTRKVPDTGGLRSLLEPYLPATSAAERTTPEATLERDPRFGRGGTAG